MRRVLEEVVLLSISSWETRGCRLGKLEIAVAIPNVRNISTAQTSQTMSTVVTSKLMENSPSMSQGRRPNRADVIVG